MNDTSIRNPAYQALTDDQLFEIDALCDRFDRQLVKGDDPCIETFLAEVPETARDGLLAELIAMEVEHRTQRGEEPQRDEYIRRFPTQNGVVAGVFARDATTHYPGLGTISIPVNVPRIRSNFRLIEELGRGGMGVVWLAEQDQPVKRRVAIKLIKSELNSKDVLARFDAEKQALAMMDHPNIARVLDAGTTDDGRPYFVMELVDGIPITQFCDDNKLSVDERLKLFVSVCKAVQHAHQKGIVHRDLKPSNVLVTVADGNAVPKVIDFGLAKAVEQNMILTDMTLQTEFGKVIGTVQYMSPEQAELRGPDAEDIDTRTDVYSLGVMLYELLTGSTPVEKETVGKVALLKVLEIIREEDPPRPSNRLSSASNEVNSAVSELRRLHPARLQQVLRGELDWVVMRALEKDRVRRYQTANDLAQDLSNYLSGEAVTARPPSTWYQLQKFANRNRGLVAALLAIGVALLAGIAGTTFGLIRANEKTALAEDKTREASDQRGKALEAEERAVAESQRARNSEADARFQLATARWEARRASDARGLLREIPDDYRESFEWRFCNRHFDGSDFTCYGHWKAVRSVAFSPDGTRVVTASDDQRIKIWDANSGRELGTLEEHRGKVTIVDFSPDGSRLASSGYDDMTIRIQDSMSGQTLAVLEGHQQPIVGTEFSPSGEQLMSVSIDGSVRRWDVSSGQEVSRFETSGAIRSVAFRPDGKRIVTCGDSTIVLWDATTGQELARQPHNAQWVYSVSFSPDGSSIAAGAYDIVTLWDAGLTQTLWTADAKAGWINDLKFSPDGARLAAASGDRQVRVWDVRSGTEMMALVGHGNEVMEVAFSPDGARLASVGLDSTLKFWDVRTGQKLLSHHAHNSKVVGVAFSPDGARIASVGLDRSFRLWEAETGRTINRVNGVDGAAGPAAHSVAFSPNGAYIAFVGDNRAVTILDGQTGANLKSLKGHEDLICTVAFNHDSTRIVSGGLDQTIRLWDIDSGKEITTFKGHTGRIHGVVLSPDSTRVVSASDDLTVRVWDAKSGQQIMSLNGHTESIADVALSHDGKHIASCGNDHTIRIWDVQSGKETYRMEGHVAGVTGIAFSPDGKRLVSTSFDRAVKLWNTQTGREVFTIEKSPQDFYGVAFSPDGSRIAAGSTDGFLKFFDAPAEREVTTLLGHTDTVVHFSFSDDGSQIYSESRNEKLYWDVATKQRVADVTFEPPATHTQVSPNGRWLINADRNHLLLIDLEYKNTPPEKAYRASRTQFDPVWHHEQADLAAASKNWFAATFHLAWLVKHDPDQVSFQDALHSSFAELQSHSEEKGLDIAPHLAKEVEESLTHFTSDERANPGFEEPRIQKGAFEFRKRIPGWKTTNELFEIWSTGFLGVGAYDGDQFVELNAMEEGTLFQDRASIAQDEVIEFSFAHRGRNGDDTLKLTIIDLGADNVEGGDDDQQLFTREYTTGKDAWAVYNSLAEPSIKAFGNKVRFAYTAIRATGGKGADNTEGNFLDSVEFGVGVVTAKHKAYGLRKLEAFLAGGDNSQSRYLGISENSIGIPVESESNAESIFVLKI